MDQCDCKSDNVGIFCYQAGCNKFICLECLCSFHHGHRTMTFSGVCKKMLLDLEALAKEKQNQIDKIVKDQLDRCFYKLNNMLNDLITRLQVSMKKLLNDFIKRTRLAAINDYICNKSNISSPKELTAELSSLLANLKSSYQKKDYSLLPKYHNEYLELLHQSEINKKKEKGISRLKEIIDTDCKIIIVALQKLKVQTMELEERLIKSIPKSVLVFNPNSNEDLNEYQPAFPPVNSNPYVYYWKADTLYVYFINSKKNTRGMDYLTEYSFGCCMWKNRIYFSGGGKNEEYYAKTTECEIQESNITSRSLADMLKPKCSHTLVVLNGRYIFSLGGFIDGRDSNYCEAYSVDKNKWMAVNPLNEHKAYVIACTFQNRFVYCIGGRGCTVNYSVEIYDGLFPENGWIAKKIVNQIEGLTKNNYGEAIQSSNIEIIILSKNSLLEYNVVTNKLVKRRDVTAEDLGLEIVPIFYNSWIYQIAKRSPKAYIEVYSVIKKTTSAIDIIHQ